MCSTHSCAKSPANSIFTAEGSAYYSVLAQDYSPDACMTMVRVLTPASMHPGTSLLRSHTVFKVLWDTLRAQC